MRQSCDGPGVAGSILILLSSLQYRTLLDAVRVVVVGVAGGVSSIQRARFSILPVDYIWTAVVDVKEHLIPEILQILKRGEHAFLPQLQLGRHNLIEIALMEVLQKSIVCNC